MFKSINAKVISDVVCYPVNDKVDLYFIPYLTNDIRKPLPEYLNDNGTGTNGGSHVITDGFVISGYDPNRTGTQTVTVSYYKLSATFQVVVRSP